MGRQISQRAFAGPGLCVPMPSLVDHHAPDVAARFAVPLEPGQKGTVEAAKAIQWATPMLSLLKPETDAHQREREVAEEVLVRETAGLTFGHDLGDKGHHFMGAARWAQGREWPVAPPRRSNTTVMV